MNTSLRYLPAYLGLFAAQTLALVCNAFLDIQYGGFAVEVLLWTLAFALTLRVGWRQGGEVTELGKRWMRRMLFLGALLTALIFIPMWGFPRAGLYLLAMLMVSYNCVTTTRRHLHLGLLVSLIMVMFAATHYRADWTMLFYLVPYVAAVVFTLVAEQINRKADELRQQSLGHQVVGLFPLRHDARRQRFDLRAALPDLHVAAAQNRRGHNRHRVALVHRQRRVQHGIDLRRGQILFCRSVAHQDDREFGSEDGQIRRHRRDGGSQRTDRRPDPPPRGQCGTEVLCLCAVRRQPG